MEPLKRSLKEQYDLDSVDGLYLACITLVRLLNWVIRNKMARNLEVSEMLSHIDDVKKALLTTYSDVVTDL